MGVMKHTIKLTALLVLLSVAGAFSAFAADNGQNKPETEQKAAAKTADKAVEKATEEKAASDKPKSMKAKEDADAAKAVEATETKEVTEETSANAEPVVEEKKTVRKNVFFDGKTPNENYTKAMEFLSQADGNGLSRRYYDLTEIQERVAKEDQSAAFVANTDRKIHRLVSEMIQQVGNGHKISKDMKLLTYMERPVRVKDADAAVREFIAGEDVLEKYSPKHQQYINLRKALQSYIKENKNRRDLPDIKYSHDLVQGMKHNTITEIRKRIGVRTSANPKFRANEYDKLMVEKVHEYQEKFGLEKNGVINKDFIDRLNSQDDDYVSRIKTNMERYRWLPDDLPATRIEVNMADFKLVAYRDGKEDFTMGAIVGRDAHQTPVMNTRMYQFNLNPFWTAPKGYFFRNMLPLLKINPNYAEEQNFDLMRLEKKGWVKVNQKDIDWEKVTPNNYNIIMRQKPGNINILGPIKFAIVNPHEIFLHFTSEPWLFENSALAFSSGCIRIEDPVKLAKYVIEVGEADISEEKFLEIYHYYDAKDGIAMPQNPAMNDKVGKLKKPIPTLTNYFSAYATDSGSVTFHDDIYHLDYNQARALGM